MVAMDLLLVLLVLGMDTTQEMGSDDGHSLKGRMNPRQRGLLPIAQTNCLWTVTTRFSVCGLYIVLLSAPASALIKSVLCILSSPIFPAPFPTLTRMLMAITDTLQGMV
jgi:hypothetical protein